MPVTATVSPDTGDQHGCQKREHRTVTSSANPISGNHRDTHAERQRDAFYAGDTDLIAPMVCLRTSVDGRRAICFDGRHAVPHLRPTGYVFPDTALRRLRIQG